MNITNIFLYLNEEISFCVEWLLFICFFTYLCKVIFINLLILLLVLIKSLYRTLNILPFNIFKKLFYYNSTLWCFYKFVYYVFFKNNWDIFDTFIFGVTYKIIIITVVSIYNNFKYVNFIKSFIFFITSFEYERNITSKDFILSHFKRDLIKNATKFINSVCA